MDVNKIINTLENYCIFKGYQKIENGSFVSNINEKPYFIFSPYVKFSEFFELKDTNKKGFITQLTLRTNGYYENIKFYPLITPFNLVFSMFSSKQLTISEIVKNVLEIFEGELNLERDKIYWRVPNGKKEVIQHLNNINSKNIIPWPDDLLNHPMPNLNEEGSLLKVEYHYKNGIIPIANLVIIGEKDLYKLDSVFYIERLNFILNNKNSLFETTSYQYIYNYIKEAFNPTIEDLRYITILLHTSILLINENVLPRAKKAGYFTRKYLREFFLYCSKYNVDDMSKIKEIILSLNIDNSYLVFGGNSNKPVEMSFIYGVIEEEFKLYKFNLISNLKKISYRYKEISVEDLPFLHSTYGIPPEEISLYFNIEIPVLEDINIENKIDVCYSYDDRDFNPIQWYQKQLINNKYYNFSKENYLDKKQG